MPIGLALVDYQWIVGVADEIGCRIAERLDMSVIDAPIVQADVKDYVNRLKIVAYS